MISPGKRIQANSKDAPYRAPMLHYFHNGNRILQLMHIVPLYTGPYIYSFLPVYVPLPVQNIGQYIPGSRNPDKP